MDNTTRKRILILGGGFAGLTVAMELERKLARDPSVEITLINRENFFLFTPMLHEVGARPCGPDCLSQSAEHGH
jgi:NADH dehydrogenase